MTRKTLYSFENLQSTGLDKVPVNSIVQIESAINNVPMYINILNVSNITPQMNVLTFLASFSNDWAPIGLSTTHKWDSATNVLTVEI